MARHPLLPLLLLLAVLLQAQLRPLQPAADDPLRLLGGEDGPRPVILQGRLLSDPMAQAPSADIPTGRPGPCRVLLQTAGGRSELTFAACPPLREGWSVRVAGALRRPRPAPHPLLAGPAERLARQGCWTRLSVERLEVLARPATPIADLRRAIAARFVAAAGPDRGGLLAALVLGSAVVPLPADLRADFRAAGLSHALAASGFHLSVLLGAVLALGRGLGRPARLALGGGAMALFLLLAGAQPSVVRAVLMGAIALLLLESGRRGRPLGLLGLSLAGMLLLRPAWLHDVGFQLSAAATAGLVLTARPLEQAIAMRLPGSPPGTPPGAAGWWRGWLAPALAVPVAASLWTLPLQLLHFGVVPLYAVPANLLAAPLLTPLTLGAMALAVVAVLAPPLLPPLLVPLGWLAELLGQLAHITAGLPLAQWQSGRPLPLLVLVFALALLGLVLPGLGRRRRVLAAGLGAVVLVLHLALLTGDQLLLVHQGGAGAARDLLLARHRGRAALISTRADGLSCRQAGQLAQGLGVVRFDWALLLDPVAAADPGCWRRQAGRVVAYGDGAAPLAAGQRLASRGLAVEALAMDSHALRLHLGPQRWLLLPDRQSLWTWRSRGRNGAAGDRADGDGEAVWLGFRPRPAEHRALLARGPRQVWLSGASPAVSPLPRGWRASGPSGALTAP